jgi:hypothetical protein
VIATEEGSVLATQNIGRRVRITVQPGKGVDMFLIFQQDKVSENIPV